MAAAYAALMSLMHTSELILHPSQKWLRIQRKQIESLLQKVRLLQEFLEDYSHRGHQEMAGLERQIADMANAAEDIMESHVLDQNLARSTGSEAKSSTSFSIYIQKLIEEMEDLIETKVMRIKETIGDFEEDRTFVEFSPAVSSMLAPIDLDTLVGFDKKSNELTDRLTGQQSNRQVIAIAGMGGIGKTTLAKKIYVDPYVVHSFHIRSWVTMSQNYNVRKTISALMSFDQRKPESILNNDQLGEQLDKSKQESTLSDAQLGEQLYKSLCGMRYLIVIDNLWGIEAWDAIRSFLPNNCNGSRIIITTRLSNLARQLSSCRPYEMEFLDVDQSWELLRLKVFGKEDCPFELEELGKNIAVRCGGLPLAIVVIGGLLAKSNRTLEFWDQVAENLNSIINSGDDENCLKILYLSYNNLPIHLKPCFLYIASFPQDWVIRIDYLLFVWVAEGFLKPIRGKSLEEVAYEYITDLIDRNLIFVHRRWTLGRIISCGVHDLVRDLCLREAQLENFLFVIDRHNLDIPLEIESKRRFFLHGESSSFFLQFLRPESLTRTIKGVFGKTISLASSIRLLKVLDVEATTFPPNDKEIMQLVNLRFILIKGEWVSRSIWRFTSSISQFWSLQTLIFRDGSKKPFFLPSEFWDLPQLRNLCFDAYVVLPDPPCSHDEEHGSHILENLQILHTVLNFRCTKEVIKRVPNLKELGIFYDHPLPGINWPFFCLHNLAYLHKLEVLEFVSCYPISLEYLSFPLSLRALILSGCCLPWEDMTIVGSLPNLEALELQPYAFKGLKWCPVEGEFVRLKTLSIAESDLLYWIADKRHFPILEHLGLQDLDLKESPDHDLGELATLRIIELRHCGDSTIAWAKQIREEQESWGNEGLEVIVHDEGDDD